MRTHQRLIEKAELRPLKYGTHLQDALQKVKRAYERRREMEFEIAYGELFVLVRDIAGERNRLRKDMAVATARIKELEADAVRMKESTV